MSSESTSTSSSPQLSDGLTATHSARFALLCASTILVSAFLLFQVQPIVGKTILPWFGGGPAVWTTCMLFFQLLLLAGYAYAHWLPIVGDTKRQVIVHVTLLAAALCTLPITPHDDWKPPDSDNPTSRILLLLAANVAIPYLLLATTGPLVQRWFSLACPGRSPYRLYSLSNVGSLSALLTYPFVFEPLFDTTTQGWMWSVAFGLFALLLVNLVIGLWRNGVSLAALPTHVVERIDQSASTEPIPGFTDRLLWLLLPTIGSVAFLAVTNHLCQDVAVFPFLQIVPLAIYLLSFIICFDNPLWYWRPGFAIVGAGSLGWITMMMHANASNELLDSWKIRTLFEKINVTINVEFFNDNIFYHVAVYWLALFCICMLAHGELVRRKPAARYLTRFYLMTSAGGALGGIFVALMCPTLFTTFRELNLVLATGYVLAVLTLGNAAIESPPTLDEFGEPDVDGKTWSAYQAVLFVNWLLLLVGVVPVCYGQWAAKGSTTSIVAVRNFYGALRVENTGKPADEYEDDQEGGVQSHYGRELMNGRILHGFQFLNKEKKRTPTTYFTPHSGVGVAIRHFPRRTGLHVGVIGLGAGTLAAYGELDDRFRFYEINPQVIAVAQEQFTFLKDSEADCTIVQGDARLKLELEESQQFDVFAVDAFSGDAIPVHLLTAEAMAIYLRHLKPDGVIAIHISNLHLNLLPVVVGIAQPHGLKMIEVDNERTNGNAECPSDWILLTHNEEFLQKPGVVELAKKIKLDSITPRRWTDKFSNLLQILK